MASEPEWMQRVYRALHERREGLLPLLDRLAKEAEENNSYDELYYINSLRITFLSKMGDVDKVAELRQRQAEIEPRVSQSFLLESRWRDAMLLAESFLRAGRIQEAEQDIKRLLQNVPLGSKESVLLIQLLVNLLCAQRHFYEAVDCWLLYTRFLSLYFLSIEHNWIERSEFLSVNITYPECIKSLFEAGDDALRHQIAEGCVRLCVLFLDPNKKHTAATARDVPFLRRVAEWLAMRGRAEEADYITRCADAYTSGFEQAVRRLQERGYFSPSSEEDKMENE